MLMPIFGKNRGTESSGMRKEVEAYRQQQEKCVARHFQVCLAPKQFDHLFNISSQLYQCFERVKARFLQAVDYVEETHAHADMGQEQGD